MSTPPDLQKIRLAALKTKADLYRKVTPLNLRIARVFMVLASQPVLAWAEAVFGLFLLQGVEGLPPVDPDSSLGKAVARKDRNLAKYIHSTGWASGDIQHLKNSVLKVLTRRVHNPTQQMDELSNAFEKIIQRYKHLDPQRGLPAAKNWCLTVLSNSISDSWRNGPQNEDSLSMEDEDGGTVETDIPDLDASDVAEMMDLRFLDQLLHDPEVIDDLKTVHPDAPLYLELLLDGHTQKEILGDPKRGVPSMLPHWDKSLSAWQPLPDRGYTTNILKVLRNHALGSRDRHPSFLVDQPWVLP